MEQNQTTRPPRVGTAVKLLYITLGIGVLRSIMDASMYTEMASPAFVMLISFFVLGVMGFFIFMIGKGRNWARITFLVFFIISIPFAAFPLMQSVGANPISGRIGIIIIIIQIVALVFLFQKLSSDWFREMKPK
jgi:hypothetical protein